MARLAEPSRFSLQLTLRSCAVGAVVGGQLLAPATPQWWPVASSLVQPAIHKNAGGYDYICSTYTGIV